MEKIKKVKTQNRNNKKKEKNMEKRK